MQQGYCLLWFGVNDLLIVQTISTLLVDHSIISGKALPRPSEPTLPPSRFIARLVAGVLALIHLRDHPDAGLFVSKPVASRTAIGKSQIILARRVNQQDGSFAGVVTAPLEIDVITRQMAALDIGRHGLISLRDPEMALVARYSASESEKNPSMGQKIISREFAEQLSR